MGVWVVWVVLIRGAVGVWVAGARASGRQDGAAVGGAGRHARTPLARRQASAGVLRTSNPPSLPHSLHAFKCMRAALHACGVRCLLHGTQAPPFFFSEGQLRDTGM